MTSQRSWGYNQHPRWLGPSKFHPREPEGCAVARVHPSFVFNGSDYGLQGRFLSMKMKIVFI